MILGLNLFRIDLRFICTKILDLGFFGFHLIFRVRFFLDLFHLFPDLFCLFLQISFLRSFLSGELFIPSIFFYEISVLCLTVFTCIYRVWYTKLHSCLRTFGAGAFCNNGQELGLETKVYMSLLFLFSFVWLYEFVKTRTGSLKKYWIWVLNVCHVQG